MAGPIGPAAFLIADTASARQPQRSWRPFLVNDRYPVSQKIPCALVLLVATPLLFGCASASEQDSPPDPTSVVQTSLPGLATPSSDPTLASLASMHPASGAVVQAAGPFDDRFALTALVLGRDALTGHIRVTSDVSELLELQVQAGFYDASGALLGTGRFTHHLDEEHAHASETPNADPHPSEDFVIEIPQALRGRAVAAAVGVPVLVNE